MVDFPLPCLVGCLIGIQRYWFISIPPKKNLGSSSSLPFPSPPGWSTGFPHIPGAAFMAGALFLRFLAIQGPLLREGNLNHSLQPALDFSNMYLYYSRWMLGGLGKKNCMVGFFFGGGGNSGEYEQFLWSAWTAYSLLDDCWQISAGTAGPLNLAKKLKIFEDFVSLVPIDRDLPAGGGKF